MIVLALGLAAVATAPLHLSDLLREAREHNPELRAARSQLQAAASNIAPAGALDDPMLMIQLWNAPVDFSNVPIMLQLTQNIPLGGKRGARREVAVAESQAAQANAAVKARDIEQEVGKAYFDLFQADRTLEVDAALEKTLHAMLTAASARVASGKGEQVDELKAQSAILKLRADRESAREQRAVANARLVALLDRDPSADLGVTTTPSLLESLSPEAELRVRALETRSELLVSKAMIANAEAQLRLSQAAQIPDIGLFAAGMHTFGSVQGERNFLFAGVQGNIPVFAGGKNRPRIDAATSQIEAARQDERSLRNKIFAEIAAAYAGVRAEERLVALHHELVPVTRQTLESALASYAAGRTSFLMVLDSERELQLHELDLAMHLAAYEQHLSELEHAVGTDLGLTKAAEAGSPTLREGARP
jgi:cobalt-zinc-cadmium efflux system outer membrane protein